jgi:hypothetical protein
MAPNQRKINLWLELNRKKPKKKKRSNLVINGIFVWAKYPFSLSFLEILEMTEKEAIKNLLKIYIF